MRHDIDLVPLAANFSAAGHEAADAANRTRLENTGSTRLVTAARMLTMHVTIVATGTIGVFEAMLKHSLGWEQPFAALDEHLRGRGYEQLADRFLDYRDAVNVLKHGSGRSHNRLLGRRGSLEFEVRALDEPFHNEGDISEIDTLVRADATFVRNCAHVVEEVIEALRRTVPDVAL